MEQVLHSKPWITQLDVAAVSKTLSSSMLAQGERTRELERRLAAWINAEDGVAVASGSMGVMLALHGIEVGSGDEVILPTYVCQSLLEAVLTVGATPILSDVGLNWVLTPQSVEHLINKRTSAILIPHLYGVFADIDGFRKFGVPIIEDCSQAFDVFGKRPIKGDVAVLSFHPTKCVTAGEGGMALSPDASIISRMRIYRDGSNIDYRPRLFGPLSDIAASLVLAQLERYTDGLDRRNEIANNYLKIIDFLCPHFLNKSALKESMLFRFPLRIPGGLTTCHQAFSAFGVQVRQGVDELLHRKMGYQDLSFPVAVELFNTTVSLPIYPALSHNEEVRCIEAITQFCRDFNSPT